MKQTLIDLFTSKKFLAALTAVIVYVAGRFGFDVDTAALDHIFAALLVYVGAQGVADVGKGAALARASAEAAARSLPVGGAGLLAALAIGALVAIGGGTLTACTKAQISAAATSAEHAVINCTGQELGTTPALDIDTLVAVAKLVASERAKCTPPGAAFDWQCAEDDALREGKVIGGCALVQLFASSSSALPPGARAAAAGPPGPGRAALEDFRARAAGGATFHTATGDF